MISLKIGLGNIPLRGSIPPSSRTSRKPVQPYKKPLPKPDSKTLEGLFEWGRSEETKVLNMLKLLPKSMEEYNLLQTNLEKVQGVLRQVSAQILERK